MQKVFLNKINGSFSIFKKQIKREKIA